MLSSPHWIYTSPGMSNVATHLLLIPASSLSVRPPTPMDSMWPPSRSPHWLSSVLVIVLATPLKRDEVIKEAFSKF